jgi:hypothetical protein
LNLTFGTGAHQIHIMSCRYVRAHQWRDLSRAVRLSTTESPLDELIQLYDDGKKQSCNPPPEGARRVFYKTVEDVPRLLSETVTPSFLSSLRADAPTFVPREANKFTRDRAADDQGSEVHEEIEEPDADNTDMINTAAVVETIANTALSDANELPSEEKIHATRVFQVAYRKALIRRRKATKTVGEASRMSFFEACQLEARNMEWPHGRYYRMLFLGPLPHGLVCLDAVHSYAARARDKAKKRFKMVSHQELEDIGKKMTEFKSVLCHFIKGNSTNVSISAEVS